MEAAVAAFVCYKIVDVVVPSVTDPKLMELGLVLGDILVFRKTLPGITSSSSLM